MRRTAANSQRIAKSFSQSAKRALKGQHKTKSQTFRGEVSKANRGLWRGK